MNSFPLLSTLIFLPIVGGALVLAFCGKRPTAAKWTALLFTVATFLLSVPLLTDFDRATAAMQFSQTVPWISALDIYYRVGVDGLSMPLVLLTTFIAVFVVIAGWEVIKVSVSQYMAAFMIMEGLMIGVFSALDAMLFYVFWEAMLIPMFIIIGVWGGPRRVYATMKFFLYTFFGSVVMLAALIYLYVHTGSFNLLDHHVAPLTMGEQMYIFIAFLLAFAVKVPMWPVHTWLPDAHVEAPTGGSVVLAAIMLKMGGYGFVRLSLPITPDASRTLDWLIIGLSLIAVVYIGLVALAQKDMKKLIAYSSIAHMGYVTLGFFLPMALLSDGNSSAAALGVEGGMVQMISHGLISGALFLCIGVLYDRVHSREIASYGGVANTMPVFAALMVFFALSNAGLPGTSGFVGEFMVILASFQANFWYAFLSALTLIFGAAYTLWLVKRVLYGEVANDDVAALTDVNARELFMLAVLALSVLVLGLWPAPLFDVMHASVEQLLEHISLSKL